MKSEIAVILAIGAIFGLSVVLILDPSILTHSPYRSVEPLEVRTVTHLVRQGETLEIIARRYGVPPGAILAANEGADAELVVPGSELTIPLVPSYGAVSTPTPEEYSVRIMRLTAWPQGGPDATKSGTLFPTRKVELEDLPTSPPLTTIQAEASIATTHPTARFTDTYKPTAELSAVGSTMPAEGTDMLRSLTVGQNLTTQTQSGARTGRSPDSATPTPADILEATPKGTPRLVGKTTSTVTEAIMPTPESSLTPNAAMASMLVLPGSTVPTPTPTTVPTRTPKSTPTATSTVSQTPLPTGTPTPTSTTIQTTPATNTPTATSTTTRSPPPTDAPTATSTTIQTPPATNTPTPTSTTTQTTSATNTATANSTSTQTPLPTGTPTAAHTITPTPGPKYTPVSAPNATMTPVPTKGESATFTPTATPEPTSAPTLVPTDTSTPVLTNTATLVPTDTETATPTDTATPVPTDTATPVPTNSATPVPTDTPTLVPTDTPTLVPMDTSTLVPTDTATPVPQSTPTPESTDTPTLVPTDTPTPGPTDTSTTKPTDTPTSAPTDTPIATSTNTPTSAPTDVPTVVLGEMTTQVPTDASILAPTATSFPELAGTGTPPPAALTTKASVSVPVEVEPAPSLLHPGYGHATGDGRVSFAWDWHRALRPDECFELVMSGDEGDPFWGAVACQTSKDATFNVRDAGHIKPSPDGIYFWTVRVNRQLPKGEWVTISEKAQPLLLSYSPGGAKGRSQGGGGDGKPDVPP